MKTLLQSSKSRRRLSSKSAPQLLATAFDPDLPEDGALIVAEVLRDQFTALNDDIQTRATETQLNDAVTTLNASISTRTTMDDVNTAVSSAISGTSDNSNNVSPLGMYADANYNSGHFQDVINKIDELIAVLRR